MEIQELRSALEAVRRSADNDHSRYTLDCVAIFEASDGGTDFVATDGRRLAHYHSVQGLMSPDAWQQHAGMILVKNKGVSAICRAINNSAFGSAMVVTNKERNAKAYRADCRIEGQFCVAWNAKGKGQEVEGKHVEADRVKGRFPKWQDVVPNHDQCSHHLLTGSVEEFGEFLNGTSIEVSCNGIVEMRRRAADIEYTPKKDTTEGITCLNVDYLRDMIRGLNDKHHLRVTFVDHDTPVMGRCGDATYVVMPLSLDR